MANELLVLKRGSNTYVLSSINREYSRDYIFEGALTRAISGKLCLRQRAYKTAHKVSWDTLTYDTAPDGGIGLRDLENLVLQGGVYTLEVKRYPASNDPVESFQVVFDPEKFKYDLVNLRGQGRRIWKVSVTLLEV